MARDVTKLPQWAQERIINLEAQVRYYQAEVDKGIIGAEFPRSNLHLLSESGVMDWAPSRYGAGRVMLGPKWDDFIDFRYDYNSKDGPRVYVHTGLQDLTVRPNSGNALFLSIKR